MKKKLDDANQLAMETYRQKVHAEVKKVLKKIGLDKHLMPVDYKASYTDRDLPVRITVEHGQWIWDGGVNIVVKPRWRMGAGMNERRRTYKLKMPNLKLPPALINHVQNMVILIEKIDAELARKKQARDDAAAFVEKELKRAGLERKGIDRMGRISVNRDGTVAFSFTVKAAETYEIALMLKKLKDDGKLVAED